MKTEPLRKVFKKVGDIEQQCSLLDIKKGDTIRFEPADETDKMCVTCDLTAESDGFVNEQGTHSIQVLLTDEVEYNYFSSIVRVDPD